MSKILILGGETEKEIFFTNLKKAYLIDTSLITLLCNLNSKSKAKQSECESGALH